MKDYEIKKMVDESWSKTEKLLADTHAQMDALSKHIDELKQQLEEKHAAREETGDDSKDS